MRHLDRGRVVSICALLGTLALLLSSQSAKASLSNDVPSCYAANHIKMVGENSYTRLIYVLIDQTVAWNRQLERQVGESVNSLLRPGTKFVVAEFSAFSEGRYLQVVHTGIIEEPMPPSQVENTPISKIAIFKACMADQRRFAVNMADTSILSVMQASTATLDQSDIMDALKLVSPAVRSDHAKQRVVLVVSDGLENSSVSSFYGRGTARVINPETEIAKAASVDMFGNFGGARVYFVGGALMPPAGSGSLAARNGYRDPRVLHALATFWREWFARSNAKLIEFGEPALVQPVEY